MERCLTLYGTSHNFFYTSVFLMDTVMSESGINLKNGVVFYIDII